MVLEQTGTVKEDRVASKTTGAVEHGIAPAGFRLPAETVVYPGHGPATTLGHELETNPFLAELRAARS